MRLDASLLGGAACALAFHHCPNVHPVTPVIAYRTRNNSTSRGKRFTSSASLLDGESGRRKLPPGKRQRGNNSTVANDIREAKRGVARARVGATSSESEKNRPFAAEKNKRNMIAVGSAVQRTTAAMVKTLAQTDTAHAILRPLHNWSASRRRVAGAVKEEEEENEKEERSASAEKAIRRHGRRSLRELLLQISPQPVVSDTYNALVSAAAAPGKLAESVGQRARELAAAPRKARRLAEDVAAAGGATLETVASLPGRARDALRTAGELTSRAEQALADGAETCESWRAAAETLPGESKRLLVAGKVELAKATRAVETLPSRFCS